MQLLTVTKLFTQMACRLIFAIYAFRRRKAQAQIIFRKVCGQVYWVVGVLATTSHGLRITIHNPFVARNTYFSSQMASDYSIYTAGGVNNTSNSLTGLVFTPQVGTLTGGTITVYGYRKG